MFLKNLMFFSSFLEYTNGYRIQCSPPDVHGIRHFTLVAPAFPPLSVNGSHLKMKSWLDSEYRKTYPSVTLESIQAQDSPQVNPDNALVSTVVADFRDRVNILDVPPEFKTGGADWFAIFNPKVERILNVHSVHTLIHERLVF